MHYVLVRKKDNAIVSVRGDSIKKQIENNEIPKYSLFWHPDMDLVPLMKTYEIAKLLRDDYSAIGEFEIVALQDFTEKNTRLKDDKDA